MKINFAISQSGPYILMFTLAALFSQPMAIAAATCSATASDPLAREALCAAEEAKKLSETAKKEVEKNAKSLSTASLPNGADAVRKVEEAATKADPHVDKADQKLAEAEQKVVALESAHQEAQNAVVTVQDELSQCQSNINCGSQQALQDRQATEEARLKDLDTALYKAQQGLDEAYKNFDKVEKAYDQFDKMYDNAMSVCQGSNQCDQDGNIRGDGPSDVDSMADTTPKGDPTNSGGTPGGGGKPSDQQAQNGEGEKQGGGGSGGGLPDFSSLANQALNSTTPPAPLPSEGLDPKEAACAANPRSCDNTASEPFRPTTAENKKQADAGSPSAGLPSTQSQNQTEYSPEQRRALPAGEIPKGGNLGVPGMGKGLDDVAGRPGDAIQDGKNRRFGHSSSSPSGAGFYGTTNAAGSFNSSSSASAAASIREGLSKRYASRSSASRRFNVNGTKLASNLHAQMMMQRHRRNPSNASRIGRDGVTGPRTNLFQKVRTRYYEKSASLIP